MPARAEGPEPPQHLLELIARLRQSGFSEVEARYDASSFGNGLRVFERPPIKLRIVRDRGDWSAELTADGWPRHEHFGEDWVLLPPVISESS